MQIPNLKRMWNQVRGDERQQMSEALVTSPKSFLRHARVRSSSPAPKHFQVHRKEVDVQFKNPQNSFPIACRTLSPPINFSSPLSTSPFLSASLPRRPTPLHWGWAGGHVFPLRCSAVLSYSTPPLPQGCQISRRRLWKRQIPWEEEKRVDSCFCCCWETLAEVQRSPQLSLLSHVSLYQSGESLSPSLSRSAALALSPQPGPLCIPLPDTVSVHSCCAKRTDRQHAPLACLCTHTLSITWSHFSNVQSMHFHTLASHDMNTSWVHRSPLLFILPDFNETRLVRVWKQEKTVLCLERLPSRLSAYFYDIFPSLACNSKRPVLRWTYG